MNDVTRKVSADRVVALCSIFVAVLAFCVSVWEVRSARQHQRLSLSPALLFWMNEDWGIAPQGLVVRNDGVGPAFIDSVVLYDNERRVGAWDDAAWQHMVLALAIPDSVRDAIGLAMLEQGAVLRSGGEWVLLGFTPPSQKYEKLLTTIADRFGFLVWYRSTYREAKSRPVLEKNLPADLRRAK